MKKYIVGLTGASGSIYGLKLIEELLALNCQVHVVSTDTARQVIPFETGEELNAFIERQQRSGKGVLLQEKIDDFFSDIASGSFPIDGMITAPCSVGTIASMANGLSRNLLDRAAEVAIKEKHPLILVPRETPYSRIMLKNMLQLSESGATILPASPGFYHHPDNIDGLVNFIVGKILDHLDLENKLFKKWGKQS